MIQSFYQILIAIVFAIPSSLLSGFVLTQLWGWFIAPTFNLPSLNLLLAVGFMHTISFIRAKYEKPVEEDFYKHFTTLIVFSIMTSLLAWGLGYFWYWLSL
jgi:putative Mn2+ efflux pump MntP